jgi:Cu2+-exporting ATPase
MEEVIKKTSKQVFPVGGMTCSACASSVETILKHSDGVQSANVNLSTNTVLLELEEDAKPADLKAALQDVGYDLIIEKKEDNTSEKLAQKRLKEIKFRTIWSTIFTLPVFIISMFYMGWGSGKWISFILTLPVVFWFGNHFYINAYKQARHGLANMDTLVALSTSIAFIFSVFNLIFPEFLSSKGIEPHVYFESVGVIITFISLGKWLEERAKSGTASSIKNLMKLQAKTLVILREGKEIEMDISEVNSGDIVLVKPGDNIPVDGKIVSGDSYVNESMMTGEPIPVFKQNGDEVFAGTLNQKGSFSFKAEKIGKDTYLAKIIAMVQEAQGSKAPVQRLADKIASIFVPIVIILSIITFFTWIIIGGEHAFAHAFLSSIAVLVISCPCALGLATPTAIMVGIGKGAENNILIKDAESLERATKTNVIVLDKTGTLTEGKPEVKRAEWLVEEYSELEKVLLAMEMKSEHPLASAIITYLGGQETSADLLHAFESITGKGVRAVALDGETYYAGNKALLDEHLDHSNFSTYDLQSSKGDSLVFFFSKQKLIARFIIADKIRASAKEAIRELEKNNMEVHLLSGDNESVTAKVAGELNIKHYQSNVLPDKKAAYIIQLQEQNKVVAMVGDGINDAYALAQADISIAMGKGSDIAIDAAKITLIGTDLRILPKAFNLSKLTVKGIHQNLFWAFIYNIIGIPIAAGVLYPINGFLLDPMIAGAAMALSSVSVVSNSLRLKWKKL